MKVQAFSGGKEITLNDFVELYVGNVLSGAANSLRGVTTPHRLEFSVQKGVVAIAADGVSIELAGFAAQMVNDTVAATLKHLKGISSDDAVRIVIES